MSPQPGVKESKSQTVSISRKAENEDNPESNDIRLILIVDDEEFIAKNLAEGVSSFSDGRYTTTFVTSASDALELLKKKQVFALVTDMRMPELDGIHLLIEARRLYPHLPVITMTGYGSPTVQAEVARRGAFRYLQKPFKPQALVNILNEIEAMGGSLPVRRTMDPIEMVEFMCMSGKDMALSIEGDGCAGTVFVVGGEIVHAEFGSLTGREAFVELLGTCIKHVSTDPSRKPERVTIQTPWIELTQDAWRRRTRSSGEFTDGPDINEMKLTDSERDDSLSGTGEPMVEPGFFEVLDEEFIKIIGPMGTVIIDEKISALDGTREHFSKSKVRYLIEWLSKEIDDADARKLFTRSVNACIDSLHNYKNQCDVSTVGPGSGLLDHAEIHIVEALGPVGKIILDEAVSMMGGPAEAISSGKIDQLIDKLAREIPNESQRENFFKAMREERIVSEVDTKVNNHTATRIEADFDSKMLSEIADHFMKYVGPVGSFIFDENLSRLGGSRDSLAAERGDSLIEGLAAEIDDTKKRAEFTEVLHGYLKEY